MAIALKLSHDEPRLVYLALVYHRARPGSELDRETVQPLAHGLRQVKTQLGNDIAADTAVIELDEALLPRLLSAIYGSVNELRMLHMNGGRPTTTARFAETAATLWPEVAGDPAVALDIAEAMMGLHRRIERALAKAAESGAGPQRAPERGRRPRWPFRR